MDTYEFFILAGGRGERLAPLTNNCPKPLVRFGFSSRIIDFTLYNCLVSAGNEITLLTQYFSEMVEQYVQENWQQAFALKGKKLRLACGNDFQKGYFSGTADAVYQILYTKTLLPEYIVVLSADHIYQMDYQSLIQFHADHGRTATVSAVPCNREQAHRFGIIKTKKDGTIQSFHEKPQNLEGIVPSHSCPLASMGIYVFTTQTLLKYLEKNQQKTSNDFGIDILPDIVESGEAMTYLFLESNGEGAYWRDIGDLSAYNIVSEEYFNGQYRRFQFDHIPDTNNLSPYPMPKVLVTKKYASSIVAEVE